MATVFREEFQIQQDDYANAGKVSSRVKDMLKQMGFAPQVARRVAIACYEAEINLIIHTYGGVGILEISDDGVINLVFKDNGPGIDDVEKAMTPGFSTADEEARNLGFGAGMGLPNIKKVSDTFTLDTSPQGTTLSLSFKNQ